MLKIKNGFELKEIADSYIAIPTDNEIMDFSSVIMLNETGAFLWLKLENDITEEELVEAVLSEYDIDRKTVEKDVKNFIDEANKAGLLE